MTKLSNIVNDKLVSYDEWSKYIDSLKPEQLFENENKAVTELSKVFTESVKKRIPKEKFGIFFSGGVDSTLIAYVCKKFTDNFTCYTVGLENAKDVRWSIKVAEELDLNHEVRIFELKEMEEIFEETANILGPELINIVNLGVGSVETAAIKFALQDKVKHFFSGLGSEEIFAGYRRHENSDDINEECWSGLKSTWKRDFQREYSLGEHFDIELLTPFLAKEMIKTAMSVPGEWKIKNGLKKFILRNAAIEMGLKKEFALRPKKAAQYGSSFDKAISKIAKKHGYKYKKEYLGYLKKLSKDK